MLEVLKELTKIYLNVVELKRIQKNSSIFKRMQTINKTSFKCSKIDTNSEKLYMEFRRIRVSLIGYLTIYLYLTKNNN